MAQERYPQEPYRPRAGETPGAVATQPYALNWGSAVAAGFLGTVAITLMMYFIPPRMGMPPMDIGTMLGTMLMPQGGSMAFWLGMVWHFVNGIVFTIAYAAILLAFRKQSTWATGVGFGVVLWLLAMMIMPMMLSMHLLVRAGSMDNPGPFMLRMGKGWMPAMFDLVAHLVYAVIAGAIYKHHVYPRPR